MLRSAKVVECIISSRRGRRSFEAMGANLYFEQRMCNEIEGGHGVLVMQSNFFDIQTREDPGDPGGQVL